MPSQDGAIVCLTGCDDLSTVLDRIEGADGSMLMGRTLIDDGIG